MVTFVGVLRRLGPVGRRLAWNRQFRNGTGFAGERSPVLLALLCAQLAGRRIVELGCGDGSLAAAVVDQGWVSYKAFDISSVAIGLAEARRLPRVQFQVAEMEAWTPSDPFDLLLIEEAIYYLAPGKQTALLDRAFAAMGPGGRAVIVIHSAEKHAAIVERMRQRYRVLTDRRERGRCYLVLAPPA